MSRVWHQRQAPPSSIETGLRHAESLPAVASARVGPDQLPLEDHFGETTLAAPAVKVHQAPPKEIHDIGQADVSDPPIHSRLMIMTEAQKLRTSLPRLQAGHRMSGILTSSFIASDDAVVLCVETFE